MKIELKTRLHEPGKYATQFIRAKQMDALRGYRSALYFMGYKFGNSETSIYYLNLKTVDFSKIDKEDVLQKDGSSPIPTYHIPVHLFQYVEDKPHIFQIIKDAAK